LRPEVALGGTVDGLSFPHQELQSEADAEQKHQLIPATAEATMPDISE